MSRHKGKKREDDMIKHKMDEKLSILHRVDRVIFHLSCEVAMKRETHSKSLGRVCVHCCAVLNQ